ncbi:MAG: SPOR domain-containing protein [Erythrobacter sp.]
MTSNNNSNRAAGHRVSLGLALALCAAGAAPAFAQSNSGPVSREVVQALPSQDVQRLNDALRRLARNSRNLSALTDAGKASLALGDLEAAMGFFGRAEDLSPNNPSVKMGMAAVFLRRDRPIEALRLFSEAEAAGASSNAVAAERGLAFDLVGNNADAQASYQLALQRGAGPEVSRRLAISHAIAGNKEDFEIILKPLVGARDFAAFRSRAFGLAILGETGEANAIASAVMPRDLAASMAPYLEYMPRLTKAQQAAAANLGIFPKAAEIGRDDPRIAQYAAGTGNNALASAAGSNLEPQGAPLGRASTDPRRRRPDRTGSGNALAANTPSAAPIVQEPVRVAAAPVTNVAVNAPASSEAFVPSAAANPATNSTELPALAAAAPVPNATAPLQNANSTTPLVPFPSVATVSAPVVQATPVAQAPTVAAPSVAIVDVPAVQTAAAVQTPATIEIAAASSVSAAPVVQAQPVEVLTREEIAADADDRAPALAAATQLPLNTPPGTLDEIVQVAAPVGDSEPNSIPAPTPAIKTQSAQTFDLARASELVNVTRGSNISADVPATAPIETVSAPIVQVAPTPAIEPATSTETARQSVSSAFADFSSEGRTSVAPAAGAVDLSAITIAREAKPEPPESESQPEKPAHPKRYWVQIASVSDDDLLKSEYRRIARKAGDLLKNYSGHASELGETNRLLAGPVTSLKAAQALTQELKDEGIDSFVHTSPKGKKVDKIQ